VNYNLIPCPYLNLREARSSSAFVEIGVVRAQKSIAREGRFASEGTWELKLCLFPRDISIPPKQRLERPVTRSNNAP
jgi:hypothetical protein